MWWIATPLRMLMSKPDQRNTMNFAKWVRRVCAASMDAMPASTLTEMPSICAHDQRVVQV